MKNHHSPLGVYSHSPSIHECHNSRNLSRVSVACLLKRERESSYEGSGVKKKEWYKEERVNGLLILIPVNYFSFRRARSRTLFLTASSKSWNNFPYLDSVKLVGCGNKTKSIVHINSNPFLHLPRRLMWYTQLNNLPFNSYISHHT